MAKKYFVSSDQHYGITGQLLEIQRQLRMREGSPLDPEKVRIALQKIIEPGYKEKIGFHESIFGDHTLDSVLDRVRVAGYLDTSFDGREVHPLPIRSLTKEQALDAYKKSSDKAYIWDELEKNMPYTMPKAETLDVMILNFGKHIGSDEALAEMDKLSVRPLTCEELIQYGIAHPEHQKPLVGLGIKHTLGGFPRVPVLFSGDKRSLRAFGWGSVWDVWCRFPVVQNSSYL